MSPSKLIRHPALLLAVLYAAYFAMLVRDASRLPERVATHFDFRGQPNGWIHFRLPQADEARPLSA